MAWSRPRGGRFWRGRRRWSAAVRTSLVMDRSPGKRVQSQKSEVRSQRSEVGGQRSEIENERVGAQEGRVLSVEYAVRLGGAQDGSGCVLRKQNTGTPGPHPSMGEPRALRAPCD